MGRYLDYLVGVGGVGKGGGGLAPTLAAHRHFRDRRITKYLPLRGGQGPLCGRYFRERNEYEVVHGQAQGTALTWLLIAIILLRWLICCSGNDAYDYNDKEDRDDYSNNRHDKASYC